MKSPCGQLTGAIAARHIWDNTLIPVKAMSPLVLSEIGLDLVIDKAYTRPGTTTGQRLASTIMKMMNMALNHATRKRRCMVAILVAFTAVVAAFQAVAQTDATNTTNAQPSSTNTQTNAIPATGEPSTNAVPAASSGPAIGQKSSKGGFGVGAILGEPTGLSLKCWLNDTKAIDAGVAYSFESRSSLHIHSDFLFHNFDLLPVSSGQLPFYYGVGGRVKLERHEDTRAGVRAPVGLAYMFERAPVDIFVEVAPILDLHPRTKFAINGGIGVRYYFR